ncbi:MAG: asparagine synthase (glutamine-hydrolyzing) [Spirochaetota bacterium]|nr:asparagine synthase (glutamine-hydrolyzing) [Spirochaetota bacterium]
MCGIAGIYNTRARNPVDSSVLEKMIESLRHRGPDETGFHINNDIALGQSRLSIIDLSGGKQPIYNEDKTICVTLNGEIFNYIELREQLIKKGHVFSTHSDTEVLVHLYEDYGKDFLQHLNGQFGIALWDETNKELILARDRVGIRPLFYSILNDGSLLYASEMKAIFCHPGIKPELDPHGIDQIFSFWVNIPPRTVFKDINELAPGHFLTVSQGGIKSYKFWDYQYPDERDFEDKPLSYYVERLNEKLYDAVTIRLRADVPVAAYLSGGIDSSIITSLVKKYHNNDLITFSVAFHDADYDERPYQMEMVDFLNTDHRIIEADYNNIGNAYSDVVWYAEKPMIRTAPAPLYLLSGLVRDNNIKVVLTGEGADEMFGGYNIFKEDKIRRFWAKYPNSRWRPKLLSSLYPYIAKDQRAERFWQLFFKKGLTDTDNKYYSHNIRWNNTSQIKQLFNNQFRESFDDNLIFQELEDYINPEIRRWHPLCRAQYLESSLFMAGYLLSSQGDRMMMGNSVEGRFPFLDHNVIEFANTIPPKYKIKVLNEKFILKKTFEQILPSSIINRPKQPYRAPISQCFTENNNISSSMISEKNIDKFGYFVPESVKNLLKKFSQKGGKNISARDDMALVGIVSLQLLHYHFIERYQDNFSTLSIKK